MISSGAGQNRQTRTSPRPPQVRREKPRVSAFTSADIPKILALEPDLVLTFSDLQAPIAAELIRAGIAVHAFNQRDIAGIETKSRTAQIPLRISVERPTSGLDCMSLFYFDVCNPGGR
jgi:ABC-type Fe3+-hydroxamate transport system substrate-binding protein